MQNFKTPPDKEIIELCKQGQKIAAIKLYKDTTGKSLRESKDYVDKLAAQNGIIEPASKGGCFVATACYGDYNAFEVLVLRSYRDEKLLTNFAGIFFVKLYYTLSPFIAKQLDKSEKAKQFVRTYFLDPIVRKIEQRYFENK